MAMFFLTKLVVAGIKNIENPIEFEFYKKTINNDFNPDKYRIKAIYGENGSGKTAVITAVKLLKNIIENRDYLRDSNTQKVLANLINKRTRKGQIEVEFISELNIQRLSLRYSIEFEIKDDQRFYLMSERLESKKGTYSKNSYSTVYEVIDGRLVSFEGYGERYIFFREMTLNLLNQQSFVSTIFSTEDDLGERLLGNDSFPIVFHVLLFAMAINVWIDDSDKHSSYFIQKELTSLVQEKKDLDAIHRLYQTNEMSMLLRAEGTMVSKQSISRYLESVGRLCAFIQIFKPELKSIEVEKKDFDKYYKCNLIMVYEDYSLDLEFESRGIKKLIDLYDALYIAAIGGITFIDELDSNINAIYLDKLIEYLQLFGKGQLCFTAHNLSPMSVLKNNKNAIDFISGVNSVHTWTKHGNLTPENAYRKGFIEDSPFNVDATDFIGIWGKV